MRNEIKEQYTVLEKTIEVPGVSTLTLALAKGGIPRFTAGQFITVYFPDSGTAEGKAYSISSDPEEPSLSITVRAIGEFSDRLCALRPRDTITASLPYGYFSSENKDTGLVLIAAGIGIAPFRSIIRDALRKDPKRNITLFYTSRTIAGAIFKNEFDVLRTSHQNFKVHYFITRESNVAVDMVDRRMQAQDILKRFEDLDDLEFLICGAISFVRDFWRGLHAGGVPADAMYTEAFFSR